MSKKQPPDFASVDQDKNAFNAGDCVKVPVDEAVKALLFDGQAATLIDSHAGAGAYPAKPDPNRPVAKGDAYFADVARTARRIPFTVQSQRVAFVGVGPMLLRRYPSIDEYVAFEKHGPAADRLDATLRAFQLKDRARRQNGWTGASDVLGTVLPKSVVVFVDPFTVDSHMTELGKLLGALSAWTAPAILAVFNPGTFKGRIGTWHEWKKVKDLVMAWTSSLPRWGFAEFSLRKSLGGDKRYLTRVQHYSLLLASSAPSAIQAAEIEWRKRRERDTEFDRWTKV